MKFAPGDRVVVNAHLTDNYAGRAGVVIQVWPKIITLDAHQNQYTVSFSGSSAIIFNENQLEFDVLEKLARL